MKLLKHALKLDIYSVDVLRAMKREHEDRVDRLLSIRPFKSSHVLQVSAPIGDNETAVPFDDCAMAVAAEAKLAERHPIEIKLRGMRHKDSDPDYYRIEIRNLRKRFDTDLRWRFEDGKIEHLSVFGLAPIPILMELGRLISDISDASVFGRHREPRPQWTWPNDGETLLFSRKAGAKGTKRVALKLSVTAEIADDRVVQAMGGDDLSIWEIRGSRFGTSALRNQSDLTGFRLIACRVFDEIRNQHGSEVELSVFPAVPVACAVEFGRVWQPKAHPAFDIYDEVAGKGFVCRHRVESQAMFAGAA